MKKELTELHSSVREDMEKQMNGLMSIINQKLQEVTGEIQGVVRLLSEVKDRVADIERWDEGVKDTLTQLLKNYQAMQNKITDLEGRSRRNNIQMYRMPENTEGTSVAKMVENLIKTELGVKLGLKQDDDLGHQIPDSATTCGKTTMQHCGVLPSVKEKVLNAAWEKKRSMFKTSTCVLITATQRRCCKKERKTFRPKGS